MPVPTDDEVLAELRAKGLADPAEAAKLIAGADAQRVAYHRELDAPIDKDQRRRVLTALGDLERAVRISQRIIDEQESPNAS